MKTLICGDVHWSTYSSIIRSRGDIYSTRLENLIATINWVEQTAFENKCSRIVYLGDFFDKAELTAEEITALQSVTWFDIPHYFIIGNHEIGLNNDYFSSAHLFSIKKEQFNVVDSVEAFVSKNTTFLMLPYILERNRKPLVDYITPTLSEIPQDYKHKVIILSHNDIKDLQMGQWKSTEGFTLDEIKAHCNLYINGHLHNAIEVSNIINIGNITGQNFSEDAMVYPHQVLIVDSYEGSINFIENPYAFNFYKLDMTPFDYNYIKQHFDENLKQNAVVTVKVNSDQVTYVKEIIANCSNIVESKVIINITDSGTEVTETQDLSIDHIDKFKEYIKSEIGTSDKVLEELERIAGN